MVIASLGMMLVGGGLMWAGTGWEMLVAGRVLAGIGGVAVNVLQKMDLDLDTVRSEVEKQVGSGPETKMVGNIPYTPRVKKVLALAGREAKALNHSYVGTEHILLGLLREQEGVAAQVLMNLGLKLEEVRDEVLNLLGHGLEGGEGERGGRESGSSETSAQP